MVKSYERAWQSRTAHTQEYKRDKRAQQPLDRRSNGWDASAVEREREVVFFK